MKTLILMLATVSVMGLYSCEKCYECTSALGTTTDCCGDKDECETFRTDCDFNGGRID